MNGASSLFAAIDRLVDVKSFTVEAPGDLVGGILAREAPTRDSS
jgi:hypothetical protein